MADIVIASIELEDGTIMDFDEYFKTHDKREWWLRKEEKAMSELTGMKCTARREVK